MFVVIYTPGPAWQTVKTVAELPFFREHYTYMQQLFAARQLLMGGPFLDNQGALVLFDVESEAQARDIVAHDPFVQARVVEPHPHPWHAYFNQYQVRSTPGRTAALCCSCLLDYQACALSINRGSTRGYMPFDASYNRSDLVEKQGESMG